MPSDPAEDCQKACEEASATVQQLSRSDLQNLMEDSDALNRLVADIEKVILFIYDLQQLVMLEPNFLYNRPSFCQKRRYYQKYYH